MRSLTQRLVPAAVVVLSGCLAAATQAGVLWDESIHGDITGDRLNPLDLAPVFGSNTITATSNSGDREYVTLAIPAGLQLSALTLVSYTGADGTAFIGVQAGESFTEDPTAANPANILGYTHFGTGPGNVGQNILPSIGTGPGSIGFTGSLSGSTYTFWIQQTSSSSLSTYTFDFVLTPEPASVAALTPAALALRRARRSEG